MQINLIIILSTLIVSLISIVGMVTLTLKKKILKQILFILVAFSAGSLLGAAFFDILPEVVESSGAAGISYILAGIMIFLSSRNTSTGITAMREIAMSSRLLCLI